jgi:hypothetical protein
MRWSIPLELKVDLINVLAGKTNVVAGVREPCLGGKARPVEVYTHQAASRARAGLVFRLVPMFTSTTCVDAGRGWSLGKRRFGVSNTGRVFHGRLTVLGISDCEINATVTEPRPSGSSFG